MNWIATHFYVSAVIGALLVIGAGFFVAKERAPIEPSSETVAWAGFGTRIGPVLAASENTPTPLQSLREGVSPTFISLPNPFVSSSAINIPTNDDLATLLASIAQSTLSSNTIAATTSAETNNLFQFYSFIPQGLIATSTPQPTKTARQAALLEYGNAAGGIIASYGDSHKNQAEILKDFLADRSDASKIAAAERLAEDLRQVGVSIGAIGELPSGTETLNKNIGNGYIELGAKMKAVAEAGGDQELLSAVQTYNLSADSYTKAYLGLVNFFSISGVHFSASDPGRIFTFSQ